MNTLLVSNHLKNTIESINDLQLYEFKEYRKKYKLKYKDLIESFPYFQKLDLTSTSDFYRDFVGIKEIYNKDMLFTHTRIKTGGRMIMIPVELEIEMNIIFSKDLNERGLFRRCAPVSEVNECRRFLFEDLKDTDSRQDLIAKLKKYDIITHTVVFKSIFDNYNQVFPKRFRPQLIKIAKIEDTREKLILTKIIILSLPDSNRYILDCICKFFNCIHNIVSDQGTDYSENMDMSGFAAVMGPKFFAQSNNITDMTDLTTFISLLDFIFKNYREIFKVEDI